jgi:hypothetical protein
MLEWKGIVLPCNLPLNVCGLRMVYHVGHVYGWKKQLTALVVLMGLLPLVFKLARGPERPL